jgi:hypothetical protein
MEPSPLEPSSGRLGRASSAFALAAAITVLFNTALAWAKESYHPLNKAMAAITGHHWTTHALADLIVFFGLGLIFFGSRAAEKIEPGTLTGLLIGAVAVASLGLFGFYLIF